MGSKSFEKRLAPVSQSPRNSLRPRATVNSACGEARYVFPHHPNHPFVRGSRFITTSALKCGRVRTAGIVLMRLWRRRPFTTTGPRCGEILAGHRLTATSRTREKTVSPTTLAVDRPHAINRLRSAAILDK